MFLDFEQKRPETDVDRGAVSQAITTLRMRAYEQGRADGARGTRPVFVPSSHGYCRAYKRGYREGIRNAAAVA